MPSPFAHSLNALGSDRHRLSLWMLGGAGLLIGVWGSWMVLARVTLYAVTESARLEVDAEPRPVEAAYGGRVRRNLLALGREVKVGDLLVELESETQQWQIQEDDARIAAGTAQIAALEMQVAAEKQVERETLASAPATLSESKARLEEVMAAAQLSIEEVKRLEQLRADGLVPELQLVRGRAESAQRVAQVSAHRIALERQEKDLNAKASGQQARLASLERDLASLKGEITTRQAGIQRLKSEIERRLIRAPASGRLGETATLQVGQVLREGDKLGAILPNGVIRAVADFATKEALGRIRPGQQGWLRLSGFPWVQYGKLMVVVQRVADEPRSGKVRVELTVYPKSAPRIPLQHGLPGTLEIELEKVSPATLVMRAVGQMLSSTTPE